MSKLSELQRSILETNEVMAEVERAIARDRDSLSLRATMDSLEKRYHELELEFVNEADNIGFEICSYRVFTEDETPTIKGLATVLGDFQSLISIVYDAVKSGCQRLRVRISPEIAKLTELGFGYTFPGSVGVVLTMPRELLLFGEGELDESIKLISDMARLKEPPEVLEFSKRLGPASIRALYKWSGDHENAGLGVDIKWRRREIIRTELFAQRPELKKLHETIGVSSEEHVEEQSMYATLMGANVSNQSFELLLDNGEKIRGKLTEAINEKHTVELPKRYKVTIKKTSIIRYSTEEEVVHYQMQHLEELS
jgi:hypothetical protein